MIGYCLLSRWNVHVQCICPWSRRTCNDDCRVFTAWRRLGLDLIAIHIKVFSSAKILKYSLIRRQQYWGTFGKSAVVAFLMYICWSTWFLPYPCCLREDIIRKINVTETSLYVYERMAEIWDFLQCRRFFSRLKSSDCHSAMVSGQKWSDVSCRRLACYQVGKVICELSVIYSNLRNHHHYCVMDGFLWLKLRSNRLSAHITCFDVKAINCGFLAKTWWTASVIGCNALRKLLKQGFPVHNVWLLFKSCK